MDLNIQHYIPQRYPFQMIDQLESVEPGKGATAKKLISINEWFFEGQKNPEMPRPFIIESLAQTGVSALLSMPKYKGKNVFFGAIKHADFKSSIKPGDELTLKVKMLKIRHNIGVGHGSVVRDGKEIVAADLIFAIE
ncbi:beta-hydroxyacyl-ACP dehydratase [Philodulcilactobacillus myokoensis]|uniref:Beta-hydroxyacyl-ACP dehydratase n=1 Tax=Philodulcilactobacillus myokoensis TaxID=2929573 RepID=A0A9W6ERP0_9LACO|nr:3-hydroxyacyl-ACP dehydratase FabZ family protein [Philodulcilactobacillus myokoensis]GLB46476.1 beta-hydroxyacyl-ACP dehydratase [Philodulcilactobacillus myokoensis]